MFIFVTLIKTCCIVINSAEHIQLYLESKHIVLGEDLHLDVLAPESTGTSLTSLKLI